MFKKKLLIASLLLVTLVVAGVGLASAQGTNPPPRAPEFARPDGRTLLHRSPMFPIARDMVKAIADKLGMSVSELEKEIRSGKSILVVADEKSVSKDDLVKAAVESQSERLQKAVDNGRITSAQKTWIEQKAGERVGNFLDRQGVGKLASPAFTKEEWEAIADKLGMDGRALRRELRGKTLAAVAEEKGVSLDDLTKAALDTRKAALDDMVKDGHITQAQADVAFSNFRDHLNKCVEEGEGLACHWGAQKFLARFNKARRAKPQFAPGRSQAFGRGGWVVGKIQGYGFVPMPGRPPAPPQWGPGVGAPMPQNGRLPRNGGPIRRR